MHNLRLPCKPQHTLRRSPRDEHRVVTRQRLPARMAKARAVLEWMERCYGVVPTTINFLELLYACHEAGSDSAAEHAVCIIRHMQVRTTATHVLVLQAVHCCVFLTGRIIVSAFLHPALKQIVVVMLAAMQGLILHMRCEANCREASSASMDPGHDASA